MHSGSYRKLASMSSLRRGMRAPSLSRREMISFERSALPKSIMQESRPLVQMPPSAPWLSNSFTRLPARAAAIAAAMPAGPPPATIRSYSPPTGMSRATSRNVREAPFPHPAKGAAVASASEPLTKPRRETVISPPRQELPKSPAPTPRDRAWRCPLRSCQRGCARPSTCALQCGACRQTWIPPPSRRSRGRARPM